MKSYLCLCGIALGSITENDVGKEPEVVGFLNEDFDSWCQQWGYSFNKGSLCIGSMVSFRADSGLSVMSVWYHSNHQTNPPSGLWSIVTSFFHKT